MHEKITVRNPGCQFCRYYIAPFDYKGNKTAEACAKGGRRVFERSSKSGKKWRWVDCAYSEEKNKGRYCLDFRIDSFFSKIFDRLILTINRAEEQLPPSHGGEKWWNT